VRAQPVLLGIIAVILGCGSLGRGQEKAAEAVAPPPDAKAAIFGTIGDQKGQGIANAIVTADNGAGVSQNATTDGQGQYAITDIPTGVYTISVVSGNTKIFQVTAAISPGQAVSLDVKGAVNGATVTAGGKAVVSGTLNDLAGTGIPNAAVTFDDGAGTTKNLTTDAQGSYAAKDLPSGTYTIQALVSGARIFKARLVLSPDQVVTLGVGGAPTTQALDLPPPSAPGAAVAATAAPPVPVPVAPPAPALQVSQNGGTAGSLNGGVSDQSGAVIVGATVQVSNAAGLKFTATSNEQGNYVIKNVPPGSYTITVTAPGFKTFTADSVKISAGVDLPLDALLEPAGTSTEVNVEGQQAAQVETENAQVQGTITETEVKTLGLNGRNFTQLIALTPGVSNQTGQDEAKVGVVGSVKYSVNGGRVEYNTFEVDGSDVLNAGLNGAASTLMVYPSLDAIQEVKVLTSNYGAMYGRTASGTVLVTTKSGGSQWHGGGYEFIRNEFFNARNYFDQTNKAPLYRRNDFGFTIGGPLSIPGFYNTKKDKTFVFWSEEVRIEKSPSDLQPNFNRAVPSLAERQGDFSDVCPPANGSSVIVFTRSQYPDCPSFGTVQGGLLAFPNNNITGSGVAQLDTNALAILSANLIPLPNSNTGCNSPTGSCYDAVISEPTHWREELGRIDHNVTAKLRASFRYIHDAWDTVTPVPEWSYAGAGFLTNSFPTVQNKFVGPGISLVAHLTDTITATSLNDFTASFVNSHITLNDVNGPGGANFLRPAGLSSSCENLGSNATSGCLGTIFHNGFGGKVPGLVIGGNNQEYGGNGFSVDPAYMPWEHTNPTYSVRDDFSRYWGKHLLQFGGQFIQAQRNENNNAVGSASGDLQGLLTFSNVNGGFFSTGNAFANFLALLTASAPLVRNEVQSYTQDSAQLRYHNDYRIGEPYIQDDWKVTPHFTVNLGVRFSLFGVFHEKDHNAYNFDPSAWSPALASQLSVVASTGQLANGQGGNGNDPIPLSLTNLDPRITNGIVRCGINKVPDGCMTGHLFNPAPRVGLAWDPFGDGKTSIRGGYGIFFEHGTGQEANTGSLEGAAPLNLSVTQDFPGTYACIGGGTNCPFIGGALPGAFPISVTAIPTRAVWSYAQQWSLSVERQLPKSMVGTIAYVGSKGTHLTVERQINQLKPVPAALNPFGPNEPLIPEAGVSGSGSAVGDCGGFGFGTQPGFLLLNGTTVGVQDPAYINLLAACAGENVPPAAVTPNVNTLRPYPGYAQIFSLQNVADSSYSAVQATIRRTKGPLTIGASYSYSHAIDDSSDRSDATFVNSYDLRSNRGSSNFDQRHLVNLSYVYDLPSFGRSLQGWAVSPEPSDSNEPAPAAEASRLMRWLGDGWQISGITVVQSGTPFSVINGGSATVSVLDNAGVANGVGAGSYPDVIANAPPPTIGRYNPQSFGPLLGNPNRFVAPRGLTFGNAGRNSLNNPRRTNFDISLLKHFKVTESGVLEFRVEAFNLFNHTEFRIYNPDLGNTGSNTISCYGGPNYSAGFSPAGGGGCLVGSAFLRPVDAHRPRTIQLGAKFNF